MNILNRKKRINTCGTWNSISVWYLCCVLQLKWISFDSHSLVRKVNHLIENGKKNIEDAIRIIPWNGFQITTREQLSVILPYLVELNVKQKPYLSEDALVGSSFHIQIQEIHFSLSYLQ